MKIVSAALAVVLAGDAGYAAGDAVRQLNAYAKANGYESWVKGKIGSEMYPELRKFCDKVGPSGILIFFHRQECGLDCMRFR